MSYSATNTEHAGDKRSCSSFWGHRAEAKVSSRIKRRAADRRLVAHESAQLGQTQAPDAQA